MEHNSSEPISIPNKKHNRSRSMDVDLDLINFSPPELRDRVEPNSKEKPNIRLNPPELYKRIEYISHSLPNIKIDYNRKIGSSS